MSPPPGAAAVEAERLFERLRELSEEALGALEAGDGEALREALGERDRLAERITPLVRELEAADAPERTRALEAARGVQAADERLEERLRTERDRIAGLRDAALGRLREIPSPRARGGHYLPPRPRGVGLDVRY